MVPGPVLYVESVHDITQTLFARRLSIQVDDQLDPRGKMLGITVGASTLHILVELPAGDHVDQLPEYCARICHGRLPPRIKSILVKSILPKREAGLYITETLLGQ